MPQVAHPGEVSQEDALGPNSKLHYMLDQPTSYGPVLKSLRIASDVGVEEALYPRIAS